MTSNQRTLAELQERVASRTAVADHYRELAHLLSSEGRLDEASAILSEALDMPFTPHNRGRIALELGWLLYETSSDITRAANLARLACDLLGRDGEPESRFLQGLANALRAYCHHLLDEELEAASAGRIAIGCLEDVLSANSIAANLTEAYLEAARLHAWLGDAERASSLAREYLGRVHDTQLRFSGLIALSEALRRQRRYQEARAVAEEAVAAATGVAASFLALSTKAAVEVDAHELGPARETIARASALLPTHPFLARDLRTLTDTAWRLAETSYDLQRYEEAGEALTRILSLHAADDSDRRRALLLLGHCHLALGRNAPARQYYEEVLRSPRASGEETQTALNALAKL